MCDAASAHRPGLGAVLLQGGHPVAFYSRKLSSVDGNYAIQELEMLAVLSALEEFRCYLDGAEFTVVSDHQPNIYLDTMQLNKRRARWLETTSCFKYRWVYRPGRINVAIRRRVYLTCHRRLSVQLFPIVPSCPPGISYGQLIFLLFYLRAPVYTRSLWWGGNRLCPDGLRGMGMSLFK